MKDKAANIWGVLRIAMGWLFFWAFIDKLFGLGFATPPDRAWLAGGSPTAGYLSNATAGPLAGIFQGLADSEIVKWLFMLGLLGIGLALILGIGVKIASYTGAAMMVFMFVSALLPDNNPIMDDHIIYAIVLIGLDAVGAGKTLGLGRWWAEKVKNPILI